MAIDIRNRTQQLPPEALAEQAAAQKAIEPAAEPTPIPEPGSTEQPAGFPFGIHPSSEIEPEPAQDSESWFRRFYTKRVVISLAIAFGVLWCLADYASSTSGDLHPGQIVYSNEMAQLWTAGYRLVFVIASAVALLFLLFPALVRYWQHDAAPAFDAFRDFKALTPHQRLWFSFALLAFLCYLFVQLLSVKLPESLSVGP